MIDRPLEHVLLFGSFGMVERSLSLPCDDLLLIDGPLHRILRRRALLPVRPFIISPQNHKYLWVIGPLLEG